MCVLNVCKKIIHFYVLHACHVHVCVFVYFEHRSLIQVPRITGYFWGRTDVCGLEGVGCTMFRFILDQFARVILQVRQPAAIKYQLNYVLGNFARKIPFSVGIFFKSLGGGGGCSIPRK